MQENVTTDRITKEEKKNINMSQQIENLQGVDNIYMSHQVESLSRVDKTYTHIRTYIRAHTHTHSHTYTQLFATISNQFDSLTKVF